MSLDPSGPAERLYEYVRSLGFHGPDAKPWSERSPEHKELWIEAVRVVLAATPPKTAVAAGMMLVPVEPTEAMVRAGIDNCRMSIRQDRAGTRQMTTPFEDECGDIYRAMLAAVPPPINAGKEGVGEAVRKLIADMMEERAAYFDRTTGHYDRQQAAASYRATAKALDVALATASLQGPGS